MDIFSDYEYEQEGVFGIIFDTKINIGNSKIFDKYTWTKYVEAVKIEDRDTYYHGIVFNGFPQETIKNLAIFFNKEWATGRHISVSELFIEISDIFNKMKQKLLKKEYLGLIGEMAFIKKCQILGFNKIINYYSNSMIDSFDFHFINTQLDIKLGNILTRSFILNLKQMNAFASDLDNHEVSVIFPEWDTRNGKDLLELFNCIENKESLEIVKDAIYELKNNSPALFEKHKINIEKSCFIFYNKEFLPKISLKKEGSLVDAKFQIFADKNEEVDFESKMKVLLRNE